MSKKRKYSEIVDITEYVNDGEVHFTSPTKKLRPVLLKPTNNVGDNDEPQEKNSCSLAPTIIENVIKLLNPRTVLSVNKLPEPTCSMTIPSDNIEEETSIKSVGNQVEEDLRITLNTNSETSFFERNICKMELEIIDVQNDEPSSESMDCNSNPNSVNHNLDIMQFIESDLIIGEQNIIAFDEALVHKQLTTAQSEIEVNQFEKNDEQLQIEMSSSCLPTRMEDNISSELTMPGLIPDLSINNMPTQTCSIDVPHFLNLEQNEKVPSICRDGSQIDTDLGITFTTNKLCDNPFTEATESGGELEIEDEEAESPSRNVGSDDLPDLANDPEFMQFVESGWLVRKPRLVPVKPTNANHQITSAKSQSALPLFIGDIHRIVPGENMQLNTIFGQRFSSVMFYGTCCHIKLRNAQNQPAIYKIDDGTACITVFHYITNENKRNDDSARKTMQMVALSKTAPVYRPMYQLMRLIKERCKAQIRQVEQFAKVAVIGAPFMSSRNEICVRAYEIYQDHEMNNDKEILFKHTLIEYYERDYVNYTHDNQLKLSKT